MVTDSQAGMRSRSHTTQSPMATCVPVARIDMLPTSLLPIGGSCLENEPPKGEGPPTSGPC